MSTISAKYTLKDNLRAMPIIDPTLYPLGYDDDGYKSAAWEAYVTATTDNALLPFTFGSVVSAPILGEISYILNPNYGMIDPLTGLPDTNGRYLMQFWNGYEWQGSGGGGGTPGLASDVELLLSGSNPTFSHSYSVVRNGDNTIQYETWTNTTTAKLRRRMDYTYSSGKVQTIRCRVYSPANGTTVVGDITETYSYVSGLVSSVIAVRAV